MPTPLELAELAFYEIREAFSDLVCHIDREPGGGLDLELVFPEQAGLSFAVSLNLQNVDELHLSAPGFWVEWFPSELQSALVVSCIDIWALRPAVGGGPGS